MAPVRLAELIEILVPTSNLSIEQATITINLFDAESSHHTSLLMPKFKRTMEFVTVKSSVRDIYVFQYYWYSLTTP